MALTYTPDPEIGKPLPSFKLPGIDGKAYTQNDFLGAKALLVMFICNHCPYVKAIEDRLIALGKDYSAQPLKIAAICSNDPDEYPEDSFSALKARANEKGYPFPYLHDETQTVAKTFGAVCTPDFFLYDGNGKLAYRGRLDDSWKDPTKTRSQDMRVAIDSLLAGKPVTNDQIPSMGCNIKWKKA
jgi:peroxiredoxin